MMITDIISIGNFILPTFGNWFIQLCMCTYHQISASAIQQRRPLQKGNATAYIRSQTKFATYQLILLSTIRDGTRNSDTQR